MSGVLIAGALLTDNAPVTSAVPVDQIKAWALPQGTRLPSLLVTKVSRTHQQLLAKGTTRLVTERVQATVRAANGEEREAILTLVRAACGDRIGTIAGFANVAVLLAGDGPDFMDDAASIFMGSVDLRVSFSEPT